MVISRIKTRKKSLEDSWKQSGEDRRLKKAVFTKAINQINKDLKTLGNLVKQYPQDPSEVKKVKSKRKRK